MNPRIRTRIEQKVRRFALRLENHVHYREHGGMLEFIGGGKMGQDLNTAQRKKPAPLVSSDEDLHALIDTVPDAMVVSDRNGVIIGFSRGAEAMFGYSESDVAGKNVTLLMPAEDDEKHDQYIKRYIETGEPRIIGIGQVTTARRKNGHVFSINLNIGELTIGGQKTFVAHIHDLTEKRQTEQKLHTLLDELAHVTRIASMGSLASSLAHELNQPLTAVANYANAARNLLSDPNEGNLASAREAMDECVAQSIRAGQIIQRLREFVRQKDIGNEISSLKRLIKEASSLALMNGDGQGVEFETDLNSDVDVIMVDPVQIQQVVVNLLRNALEAMLETPTRHLKVASKPHSDDFVEVVVSDSGPGMTEDVSKRLFEPFNSTKPYGMGLGLSISRDLVNAHGGRIWAEPSTLGGTAVHFTLPLADLGDENG